MEDKAKVEIKLEDWVEAIIERAVSKHVSACPVHEKVQRLEIKWAQLVGFMLGSGTLGGVAGSVISKVL